MLASVSIIKFSVISQLKQNWETVLSRKHILLCTAPFLFLLIWGWERVRLELKEWKISDTSFHREDKHIAEFLHPSWHGCLYIHQLIWLQLLLHTHWMWLVQVSMLAHKVWAFFAFILHSAMTSRYMHQMKVVSRWQLQHLQRVCLLWRESWLQFWCKWWNQPTQMDSWTMTVILASIRTCKLQVQKQRKLQKKISLQLHDMEGSFNRSATLEAWIDGDYMQLIDE